MLWVLLNVPCIMFFDIQFENDGPEVAELGAN